MDSSGVRLGPVNPAASLAFGKSIMPGKDVRRHAARHEFTCDRGQHVVASRASGQRNRARVELEASDSRAQLTPDGVVLDEENVAGGSQALVARQQDSAVCAGNLQELGAGQRWVRN